MKKLQLAAVSFFSLASLVIGQNKLLTLDEIFGSGAVKRVRFGGSPITVQWSADGKSFRQVINGQLMRVDAITGQAVPYFNSDKLGSELTQNGVAADRVRTIANSQELIFNAGEAGVLVNAERDLWYFENGSGNLRRLTNDSDLELEAEFSPDGRWVSFVKGNNLFVVDTTKGDQKQLTRDGREGDKTIYNGYLDWVYEEELYGRGVKKGYWWSPDSKYIALLRLDEENVPKFTIPNDIPKDQIVETEFYPKPGDPNPVVKLGIADVGKAQLVPNAASIPKIGERLPPVLQRLGDSVKWVDLAKYKPDDLLIGRVAWAPDDTVYFQAQNREQTYLDLSAATPDGRVRKVLTETSPAWVGINDNPNFLKDGTFIWQSERDGWDHLYRYSSDGKMLQRLTDGKWEVRTVYGVSPDGWIYFSSIKDSPIAENVYRVRIDGGPVERLTKSDGWHAGSFNADLSLFVNYTSEVMMPSQVRLYRSDGSLVRSINENKVAVLADYKLSKPEFLKVKTRDGFDMEAMMIKPPDFDPSMKYPVLEFTYSGPHAPQVANRWGGNRGMWFQMLAQRGFIVWVLDNRTASGKGVESTWPMYKRMYELELRDLEDGITYLKSLPYVDPSRIALHGWSYGGSMTTYAMTHSRSWKVGIAGGTVSDERLYDSIYTERYMLTPQHNAEGYESSSVLKAAKNLSGKLLLIHGAIDDNVHLQNTMRLAYELQKANKQFDLMIYPTARHGLSDQAQIQHWYTMMTDYLLKNL